jgi:hypothetical protein
MKHTIIDLETGEVTERDWTADEIADAQERAWRTLRATRNELLASSDWTVLGDSPTSTAAWKTYRQALRDLPANTTDPFNVLWPTPPA